MMGGLDWVAGVAEAVPISSGCGGGEGLWRSAAHTRVC